MSSALLLALVRVLVRWQAFTFGILSVLVKSTDQVAKASYQDRPECWLDGKIGKKLPELKLRIGFSPQFLLG